LEHLHQYEKLLLSQKDNVNLKYCRHLLQVQLADEDSGSVALMPSTGGKLSSGDHKAWNKLASIVLAYRVADVVGQLNDVKIPHPKKVPRTKRIGKDLEV